MAEQHREKVAHRGRIDGGVMKDEDNTGQVDTKAIVKETLRILSVNKGVSKHNNDWQRTCFVFCVSQGQ